MCLSATSLSVFLLGYSTIQVGLPLDIDIGLLHNFSLLERAPRLDRPYFGWAMPQALSEDRGLGGQ
jgi:hypothetical protein